MDNRRRKIARISAGLSQTTLANALGVSQGYVSAIERGTKTPPPELAERMAETLGVSVDELFPAVDHAEVA